MGYEIVPEALEGAAKAASSAAEQAGSVRPQTAADEIQQAMPGSASAAAAERTGRSWRDALDRWRRDADAYADSLRAGAAEYRRQEQDAAAGLQRSGGG